MQGGAVVALPRGGSRVGAGAWRGGGAGGSCRGRRGLVGEVGRAADQVRRRPEPAGMALTMKEEEEESEKR